MRFLLRWQHVAPGTQLAGDAGLAAVIEQLQGFEAAAVGLGARAAGPPPAPLLARLARRPLPRRGGGLAPARAPASQRGSTARPAAPSKATPIAVVFRTDLRLAAGRGPGRDARRCRPSVGATAEIVETLGRRGASFASDLAAATRRLPDDVGTRPVGRRDPRADHVRRFRRHPGPRRRAVAATAARRAGPASPGWAGCPADGGIGGAVGASSRVPLPRQRPRRPGRGGGRAAAAPVGGGVPGPGRPRLAAHARGGTCSGRCAASRTGAWSGAAGSWPGSAASSTRCPKPPSSWPMSARRPQRGAGGGQRHRSPQPGGADRARGRPSRRCGPTGSPTSTGSRSRPA